MSAALRDALVLLFSLVPPPLVDAPLDVAIVLSPLFV